MLEYHSCCLKNRWINQEIFKAKFISACVLVPTALTHQLIFVCRAAGIALLVVILVALLILGCWYFKRRSGYKMIRVLYNKFFPLLSSKSTGEPLLSTGSPEDFLSECNSLALLRKKWSLGKLKQSLCFHYRIPGTVPSHGEQQWVRVSIVKEGLQLRIKFHWMTSVTCNLW